MARAHNEIPSHLSHKAPGQARVRIGGREVYLGAFGSPDSKEAYARLVAEHFADGESETIIVPDGEIPTVAACVAKYDDHAQRYYVKNGRPTDERYAIKAAVAPLLRLYGSTPAEESAGGLRPNAGTEVRAKFGAEAAQLVPPSPRRSPAHSICSSADKPRATLVPCVPGTTRTHWATTTRFKVLSTLPAS